MKLARLLRDRFGQNSYILSRSISKISFIIMLTTLVLERNKKIGDSHEDAITSSHTQKSPSPWLLSNSKPVRHSGRVLDKDAYS